MIELPAKFAERVKRFLLDKRTGNIQLNIKAGRILGMHVTDISTLNE